jgi:hypothetical protein
MKDEHLSQLCHTAALINSVFIDLKVLVKVPFPIYLLSSSSKILTFKNYFETFNEFYSFNIKE